MIACYSPHLGAGRKIHWGQKIHDSVTIGGKDYVPKAQPWDKSGNFWAHLCSGTHPESAYLLERDVLYIAIDIVKKMLAGAKVNELGLRNIAADSTFTAWVLWPLFN
jgi:hypothetical protein